MITPAGTSIDNPTSAAITASPTFTGTTSTAALTASGLITAQANIQLGIAGTISGVLTLEGSTSGAATITAPAVAGTATNPVVFSNAISIGTNTLTASAITSVTTALSLLPASSGYALVKASGSPTYNFIVQNSASVNTVLVYDTGAVTFSGLITGTAPTLANPDNSTSLVNSAFVQSHNHCNPANVMISEEFIGGLPTSGSIGQNGWYATTIGSAPVVSGIQGAYPNFGVIQIATAAAATAGQGGSISIGGISSSNTLLNNLQATTGWEIQWIFKLNQTTTTRFRAGVDTNATILAGYTGLYCRYDTNATYADTTFVFESSWQGVKTSVDSTIAVDTLWHRVKITSLVAGTATFTLYSASGVVQSTKTLAISIATTNGVIPLCLMITDATAQVSCQLDFCSVYYPGIAR